MNLSILLAMARAAAPDRIVVAGPEPGLTTQDLDERATRGAAVLQDRGAAALLYATTSGPALPVALFSAARACVPLVPLSYRLGSAQLKALAARHRDSLAIAEPPVATLLDEVGIPVVSPQYWTARTASGPLSGPLGADAHATTAAIVYTSGTTSEPKGVVLRHENVFSYVAETVELMSATEDEAALFAVPPYHIAAIASVVSNLYAGRRVVFLDTFDAEEWLKTVRAERVTNAFVVPTMLARIVEVAGAMDLPSLRALAYGGSSMPRWVIERAMALWPHVDFTNAYGLTETSSTIAVLGPEDHRAAIAADDRARTDRLASVGRVLPGVDVQIRAQDDGSPAAPYELGRIWVRGRQVSGEYTGTGSAVDADGYFDTRDEGYFDDDRYLYVVGRADDTIIRGGENIAPSEVESVVARHSGIREVVAVGIPDPHWGERVEVVVVPHSGQELEPDEVAAFAAHDLRSSRKPSKVHVWDELPRTETGKILRRVVRDEIVAHAGEAAAIVAPVAPPAGA